MSRRRGLLGKALELALEPSGPCPDGEAIYRFAASLGPVEERPPLEGHILSCAACMEVWRESRALVRAASRGVPRVSSLPVGPPPILSRGGWRPWIGAAMAAGLVGILLAGGWAAVTITHLRREVQSLEARAPAPSPIAVAALLDLTPESLRVRGAEAQAPELKAGALPSVLVLNPQASYSLPLTVLVEGADGKARWSVALQEPPAGPVTVVVPPGLLPPGAYAAEVRDSASGQVLDRYPFQIR